LTVFSGGSDLRFDIALISLIYLPEFTTGPLKKLPGKSLFLDPFRRAHLHIRISASSGKSAIR
jgi:hypothetical protein